METLGGSTGATAPAIHETTGSERELRPSELTRLLNSTPLGPVLDERQLYRHRSRAGHLIGGGRRVDLLKYVAWLLAERHGGARRRRRRGADGISTAEVLALLESQRHRCNLTGCELTPHTASLDHIVSVSKGGRHTIDNAQIVHEDVNRAKGTLTNDEFVELCRKVVSHADSKSPKRSPAA